MPEYKTDYVIAVVETKDPGQHKIAQHVGKQGAKADNGRIADGLLIHDLSTGAENYISYKELREEDILNADLPGKTLYEHVRKNYRRAVLVTGKRLEAGKGRDSLEGVVNEEAEPGSDAKDVIKETAKRYRRSDQSKDYRGETSNEGGEESTESDAEGGEGDGGEGSEAGGDE